MSQILTAQKLMLYDICTQILEIDKSIRFAGFANDMGTIIARSTDFSGKREGTVLVNER
jgi:hypothetical protein